MTFDIPALRGDAAGRKGADMPEADWRLFVERLTGGASAFRPD
jgi:hypothetical protein